MLVTSFIWGTTYLSQDKTGTPHKQALQWPIQRQKENEISVERTAADLGNVLLDPLLVAGFAFLKVLVEIKLSLLKNYSYCCRH